MTIKHIVAMDRNGCIGVGDSLPWYLPTDLNHYKENTLGKAVVMGSNTYDNMPKFALEDRTVYRVSRSKGNMLSAEYLGNLRSFHSASTDLMIAGGAEVYSETLHLAEELLITEVDLVVNGDKYYPPFSHLFTKVEESPTYEENGICFRFTRWVSNSINNSKPE